MLARDNKTINDFLAELPEGSHTVIEMADLDRLQKNEATKFQTKFLMLNDFVTAVKQQCVIKHNFFIFFDIPDLIVKKEYSRKDYESIIKIVMKVKTRYLAEKARQQPDKPLNVVSQITDDDLVPLEMFDWVLSQIQHKQSERKQTILAFLNECQVQVHKVIQKLGIDSDKTKKIVEQSVVVSHINTRMENRHQTYFLNNFRHRNLYLTFVKNTNIDIRSAQDFELTFKEVMKPNMSNNKYYTEYTQKLDKEMQKMTGKASVGDGAETNSEMTTLTKNTKKSGS